MSLKAAIFRALIAACIAYSMVVAIDRRSPDEEELRKVFRGSGNAKTVDESLPKEFPEKRVTGRRIVPPLHPTARIRNRHDTTSEQSDDESIVEPSPSHFRPLNTCQLPRTDIFVIISHTNVSRKITPEHHVFRFVRNMFEHMEIGPDGARMGFSTGGRQIWRRMKFSRCDDAACVNTFFHKLALESDPNQPEELAQYVDGPDIPPFEYNVAQALTDFEKMDSIGPQIANRAKIFLLISFGLSEQQMTQMRVALKSETRIKKIAMYLPLFGDHSKRTKGLSLHAAFPKIGPKFITAKAADEFFHSIFNVVWKPRVNRLKYLTESDYWLNRLCNFLKNDADLVAATVEPGVIPVCDYHEVAKSCKYSRSLRCTKQVEILAHDPQACPQQKSREEICDHIYDCEKACDEKATEWTTWTCFSSCHQLGTKMPKMYRNRHMPIGDQEMYCNLFETKDCPPMPICRRNRTRSETSDQDDTDRHLGEQEQVIGNKCKYVTTKACRYTLPGVCKVKEIHNPVRASQTCRIREVSTDRACRKTDCEAYCDEQTTKWTDWSNCPITCVDLSSKEKAPLRSRSRKLTTEEEVYCRTIEGEECKDLPFCRNRTRTPVQGKQKAAAYKPCKVSEKVSCEYREAGVCKGEIILVLQDCREVKTPCERKHCDLDCDKKTSQWSQWSTSKCPECHSSSKAVVAGKRDRQFLNHITKPIFCIMEEARVCPCPIGKDPEQEWPVEMESTTASCPGGVCKCNYAPLIGQCKFQGEKSQPSCSRIDQIRSGPNCELSTVSIDCSKWKCEATCTQYMSSWSSWTTCSATCYTDAADYWKGNNPSRLRQRRVLKSEKDSGVCQTSVNGYCPDLKRCPLINVPQRSDTQEEHDTEPDDDDVAPEQDDDDVAQEAAPEDNQQKTGSRVSDQGSTTATSVGIVFVVAYFIIFAVAFAIVAFLYIRRTRRPIPEPPPAYEDA